MGKHDRTRQRRESKSERIASVVTVEGTSKADAPSKDSWVHSVYETVSLLCSALLLTLLISVFLRPVVVQGDSMNPTLTNGDRLMLYCFFYTPDREDVVVIRRENRDPLIKRVVGVAGDRIYIHPEEHIVYRNGEPLQESYIMNTTPAWQMTEEVIVPAGHVFVLGDNRWNSKDSRDQSVGMISVENIVGRVVLRAYPFKDVGLI